MGDRYFHENSNNQIFFMFETNKPKCWEKSLLLIEIGGDWKIARAPIDKSQTKVDMSLRKKL